MPASRVALTFGRSFIACLYRHSSCSEILDLLPDYARQIEPQLASAPVTGADLIAHPHVVAAKVAYSCDVRALVTIIYRVDGRLLRLSADLVRQPEGWRVFAVPVVPGPVLLPAPLRPGKRLC